MDNRFFILPMELKPDLLERDLLKCLSFSWSEHFNKRDYEGDWKVISLRSASGSVHDASSHPDVPFQDTSLMSECSYFRAIVENLACEKEAVRLLRLAPGSRIH